jgi:hypothetical protein
MEVAVTDLPPMHTNSNFKNVHKEPRTELIFDDAEGQLNIID